jgi:hypothetical protein
VSLIRDHQKLSVLITMFCVGLIFSLVTTSPKSPATTTITPKAALTTYFSRVNDDLSSCTNSLITVKKELAVTTGPTANKESFRALYVIAKQAQGLCSHFRNPDLANLSMVRAPTSLRSLSAFSSDALWWASIDVPKVLKDLEFFAKHPRMNTPIANLITDSHNADAAAQVLRHDAGQAARQVNIKNDIGDQFLFWDITLSSTSA